MSNVIYCEKHNETYGYTDEQAAERFLAAEQFVEAVGVDLRNAMQAALLEFCNKNGPVKHFLKEYHSKTPEEIAENLGAHIEAFSDDELYDAKIIDDMMANGGHGE